MDGRELRRLRKQLGLTQREVGDYIGIKHQMVSQMERGERPIPSKSRPLYPGADDQQIREPSIRESIDELSQMGEDELRSLLRDVRRGPYRS